MRRIFLLFLFTASAYSTRAEATGKINFTISHGLQQEGVDLSNPVNHDNKIDTPEYEFHWPKREMAPLPPEITQAVIPHYITPNTDGVNDSWECAETEIFKDALLTLFNT